MNLELLSPFRRQIPDRVDATLTLPANFHGKEGDSRGQKADDSSPEDQEWKAAYHVAFNRRGTYLAVGHASGTVAVHDFLSRTLSALYRPGDCELPYSRTGSIEYPNGVTAVTWSRRSRVILAGALGDRNVRLIDTTHPLGPEECVTVPVPSEFAGLGTEVQSTTSDTMATAALGASLNDSWKNSQMQFKKCARVLDSLNLTEGYLDTEPQSTIEGERQHQEALFTIRTSGAPLGGLVTRYPIISFRLPEAVGGSLQINPRDKMAGLAVLSDGSLMIFRAGSDGFDKYPQLPSTPVVKLAALWQGTTSPITCASFDKSGEKVYAATKDGILMGFRVKKMFKALYKLDIMTLPKPFFTIPVPGGATVWHLLVSRNGRYMVLNCADSTLRVYDAHECEHSSALYFPHHKNFKVVVSKVPFASCDFSGDGEYLCGGVNNDNDKYDLYVWNVTTGALMDRLTGPQVSLYSVAWHPTRSFLAVATSDGVVDIWGPRKDYTSFAPDFQALPMNVEYIEEEDEYDVVDDKNDDAQEEEDAVVDVVTVDKVPVFASDSESESEVFYFETKISNIMLAGRGRNNPAAGRGADEKE
jgi:WD40 repeat protein